MLEGSLDDPELSLDDLILPHYLAIVCSQLCVFHFCLLNFIESCLYFASEILLLALLLPECVCYLLGLLLCPLYLFPVRPVLLLVDVLSLLLLLLSPPDPLLYRLDLQQ